MRLAVQAVALAVLVVALVQVVELAVLVVALVLAVLVQAVVLAVVLALAVVRAVLVAVVLELAVVRAVLALAVVRVVVLHLHTYSILFVAPSPHLEPGIADHLFPSLGLDPSPSPPRALLIASFGCR